MAFDRSEYKELENRKKHDGTVRPTNNSEMLAMMQQSAIKMEQMVRDENWNYFMTLLQSSIDKTKSDRENFFRQLTSPDVSSSELISLLRNYIILSDERIKTLEAVLLLPKQIIENGENAKIVLSEIGAQSKQ